MKEDEDITKLLREPDRPDNVPVPPHYGVDSNKPQSRPKMELLMFVFFIAKTLSDTVIVNLLEESTCLVVFNYDLANCTEPVSPTLEGLLQQSTANLVMGRSMIEAFIPSLLTLFLGPWSDTNGRRPLILLGLAGYTMSAILWGLLSLVPGLHPLFFLLPSIPVAFGGGYCIFFLALYCYISDTTEEKNRGWRMGLLEAGCLGGVLVSSLVTPYILKSSTQFGYTIVFSCSAVIMLCTFVYTYYVVPESVSVVESQRAPLWRLDHVTEMFSTCFKSRPNHIRTIVMLIIIDLVIFILLMNGELAVLYMFTQKKFGWNLIDYTRYTSFFILLAGASAVSTWLFLYVLKMPDLPLMLLGTVCSLCKALVMAVASTGIHLYIASGFSILAVLISPLSRSQLSKLIPHDDLGKIFAFTAFLESISPLAASPLYTYVYKATMDSLPNAVFWMSSGFCAVAVLFIGTALFLKTRSVQPADLTPILDNSEAGASIQA